MLYITDIRRELLGLKSACLHGRYSKNIRCELYNDETGEITLLNIQDLVKYKEKICGLHKGFDDYMYACVCKPEHMELMNNIEFTFEIRTLPMIRLDMEVFRGSYGYCSLVKDIDSVNNVANVWTMRGSVDYSHIGYIIYKSIKQLDNQLNIILDGDYLYLRHFFNSEKSIYVSNWGYMFKCNPNFKSYVAKLSLDLV